MMNSSESQAEVSLQSPTNNGSIRAERKAQSRRRILDAAREVFFRDGFMSANLDEVAERAGVAKGTLYRYFDSKADLYVAVLADNGEVFTEKMREVASEPVECARHRVEAVSRFYLDWWVRHSDYFKIFWAVDNQDVIGQLPESVVEEIAKLWESCLEVLDEVLAGGVRSGEFQDCDTWEVANILWTTANSLIQAEGSELRRRLRRKPLEVLFNDHIELVLRGLSAPSIAPDLSRSAG